MGEMAYSYLFTNRFFYLAAAIVIFIIKIINYVLERKKLAGPDPDTGGEKHADPDLKHC